MKRKQTKGALVIGVMALFVVFVMDCAASGGNSGARFPFGEGGVFTGTKIVPDKLSGGGENVTGSGRIVSKDFNIHGFTRLDISHAFLVDVVQGRSYSVTLRIDDNLEPHLRVEKRGDKLIIGLKPHIGLSLRRATMEAVVRMPELSGIEVSGASDVTISGFSKQKEFSAECSGASSLEGEISADDVRLELSGASGIRLRGSADTVEIDVSGASDANLEDFPVTDAVVELSGASEACVVLSGTLDVDAGGASNLFFEGSPSMGRIDLSGASSIKRR